MPTFFPLEFFAHNGRIFACWPSIQLLWDFLKQTQTPFSKPDTQRYFCSVGYAIPEPGKYSCAYPWHQPSLTIFDPAMRPRSYTEGTWLHCVQRSYPRVREALDAPPQFPKYLPYQERIGRIRKSMPPLERLLPFPSIEALRAAFALPADLAIPQAALPPKAGH